MSGENAPDLHRDETSEAAPSPTEARRLRAEMLRQVQADIEALDHELAVYEQRYGMSSQAFYASYARGVDGRLGSRDFAAWSELYVARLERQSLYRQLLAQPEA